MLITIFRKSSGTKLPLANALLSIAAFGLLPAGATTTVIDDHFDDGTVTGWASQGNTRTFSAHNITETGSVLTSEVVATQTNTNRGIVSTTSFDPDAESGGFSMRFVVDSVGQQPDANGFFLGIVNDDSTFFRDAALLNFGLTFYGQNARTASGGGFGLNYGDNNGGNPSSFLIANSDAQGDVELASFQDGFALTIAADPAGWSYGITGLNTAAGAAATFSDAGTWGAAGTDFASLFGADDSWFVTASNQEAQNATHTAAYDRITVTTIPEPSALLLLLAGMLTICVRRRP